MSSTAAPAPKCDETVHAPAGEIIEAVATLWATATMITRENGNRCTKTTDGLDAAGERLLKAAFRDDRDFRKLAEDLEDEKVERVAGERKELSRV